MFGFKKSITQDQFGVAVLHYSSESLSADSGRSLGMRFENYDASRGWSSYLQSVGVPVAALKLYHRLYAHTVLQSAFTKFSHSQRRAMTLGAMLSIREYPPAYVFETTYQGIEAALVGRSKFSQNLTNPECSWIAVAASKYLIDYFAIPQMKNSDAFIRDFKFYSSTVAATIGTALRAIDDIQTKVKLA